MGCRRIIAAASLALAASLGAAMLAPAGAAPQMLGLVATAKPVPLTCADGICESEISAFCLQQERDLPAPGTAYAPVEPTSIVLVARTADGREIRRPAGHLVRLNTARAQFAVRLRVPEAALRELAGLGGGESLAIEIGPLAAAAPVPVAGDADPLSAGEIAAASGPLRALAGDIAVTGGYNGTAAVVSNLLINTFRASGGRRDGLWELAFGDEAAIGRRYAQTAADPGVRQAAKNYRICQSIPSAAEFGRCLEFNHDSHMGWINIEYWNNVSGGS